MAPGPTPSEENRRNKLEGLVKLIEEFAGARAHVLLSPCEITGGRQLAVVSGMGCIDGVHSVTGNLFLREMQLYIFGVRSPTCAKYGGE